MPITFPCTSCGKTLKTPDASAGKQGKCPHCGGLMQIPSTTSALGSAAPATPSDDPFAGLSSSAPANDSPFGSFTPSSAPPPNDPFGSIPQAKPLPGSTNPYAQAPRPASSYGSSPYAPPMPTMAGYAGMGAASGAPGSRNAGLILALGILSLVMSVLGGVLCCCMPLSGVMNLIALAVGLTSALMGHGEMKRYRSGEYGPTGRSETQGGYICGIIGTSISGLMLAAIIAYVIFAIVVAVMDAA
ncbi:MAG TPA: hypothetical protein PLI18_06320 [Pirellulaceae bacterium]|nr:hypothetical protein [Pirellulaceae bacterium]